MSFLLSSPAFANAAEIPRRFTCEGENVSPPLQWSNIPSNAKSLALIVEDPDAPDPAKPQRTWVHWILYNIPVSGSALAEQAEAHGIPSGARAGSNDWHKTEYSGPCPPIGRHRYFHRLFALDNVLADLHHPNKAQLERAMQGHVLQEAVLLGTYAKQGT
jgi:Raf kinase inhibitor-like YbhB/YbcL family protein